MSLIKEAKPLETEYLVIDPVDIFKELKGTNFEDIPDKLSDLSNELTAELVNEARFNSANPDFCVKLDLSGSQGIKITVKNIIGDKVITEFDTGSGSKLLVKITPAKVGTKEYISKIKGKVEFYEVYSEFVSNSINKKRTNQIVGNNTIFKLV